MKNHAIIVLKELTYYTVKQWLNVYVATLSVENSRYIVGLSGMCN